MEETTKSPTFWQNPAWRGGNLVQNVYSQDVLALQLQLYFQELTPGLLEGDCIHGIHAVYGCLAVSETSAVAGHPQFLILSPVSDGRGSYERGSRSALVYRLGPLPGTCWDTFSSSGVRVLWVLGHDHSGNDLYLFCHSDDPSLHVRPNIYGGWNEPFVSSTW